MQFTYKRYTNRKLYSIWESRHVNLKDVAEAVRAGVNPTIICNKTKMDITPRVLRRLLSEERRGASAEQLLAEIRRPLAP